MDDPDPKITEVFFKILVEPTRPILNFVSKMESNRHKLVQGNPIFPHVRKLLFINNALFFKAEFVKTSFRIIDSCYHRWVRKLEDGSISVNPRLFYPALREVDNLILEFGTMFDLFSREVNITCDLKIPYKVIDFGKAVSKMKKMDSDSELKKHILSFSRSESYIYFKDIRNMIAHRLPFVTRGSDTKLFFPDDPNEDAIIPKMENEIDVFDTCKEWVFSFFSFIDKGTYLCYNQVAPIILGNSEVKGELDYDTWVLMEEEAHDKNDILKIQEDEK